MDIALILTLLVMFAGLIGVVLPLVPGIVLILLAAIVYAFVEGFQTIGPFTLAALTVLGVVGITADVWVSSLGAKTGGASWWGLLGGLGGAVVGLIFLSLPGAIIGAVVGVLGAELWRARDVGQALKAGGGWLVGWLLSTVVQLCIALVMIAIFLWQVWTG